jgi:DNA-binding IclR family transcriptional regulator
MAGNSAGPGRSVTSKVVAILLAFHDGSELSLTEISRLTCLPVSTAHRLVTELSGWGVLERTGESRFRVGLPVQALGGKASYTPTIVESARRVLEDLVMAARASARLGIMTDTRVAYMEKRCRDSPVSTFARTPRLPAHATALGKALLAFSSPEMVDRVIADGLERYTQNTLTDPERLRQSLASIRLTRVAISRRELEPEVSAVAVPVFGLGGMIGGGPGADRSRFPLGSADGEFRTDGSRARDVTGTCECRKSHPRYATRRYSRVVPLTRVRLRTRYCSRTTGCGSGASASGLRRGATCRAPLHPCLLRKIRIS